MSSSGASSYEDYEREYKSTLARIRSHLASSSSSSTTTTTTGGGGRDVNTLLECNRLLFEAKQLAIAMRGTAEVVGDTMRIRETQLLLERDIGPLTKEIQRSLNKNNGSVIVNESNNNNNIHQQQPSATTTTRGATSSSSTMTAAVPSTTTTNSSSSSLQRNELFSTSSGSYVAPDIENMVVSSSNNNNNDDMESLIRSSEDMLRESQSILAETEHIGTSTIQQMGQQREQLLHANNNIRQIQEIAIRTRSILTQLGRKMFRNKLALYCMITILTIANIWVIYRIYQKHHTNTTSGAGDGDGKDHEMNEGEND